MKALKHGTEGKSGCAERRPAFPKQVSWAVINARWENMSEADILRDVACLADSSNARKAALEKVKGDIGALAHIAEYSRHADTRMAAVEALGGNAPALVNLARYSVYLGVRDFALERLASDTGCLSVIAGHSLYEHTRREAIRLLSPKVGEMVWGDEVLRLIAAHSPSPHARREAFSKMSGHDAHYYVLRRSEHWDARRRARKMLEGDPEEEAKLIAAHCPDPEDRLRAFKVLCSMDTLYYVASYSGYADTRQMAKEEILEWDGHLAFVPLYVADSEVKEAATTIAAFLSREPQYQFSF